MEKILKLKLPKEEGYVYVLTGKGDVLRVRRYGPDQYGESEKVLTLDIKMEKGYLYFMHNNGYVCRIRLKNYKGEH